MARVNAALVVLGAALVVGAATWFNPMLGLATGGAALIAIGYDRGT